MEANFISCTLQRYFTVPVGGKLLSLKQTSSPDSSLLMVTFTVWKETSKAVIFLNSAYSIQIKILNNILYFQKCTQTAVELKKKDMSQL